jgi:hypothetical protein
MRAAPEHSFQAPGRHPGSGTRYGPCRLSRDSRQTGFGPCSSSSGHPHCVRRTDTPSRRFVCASRSPTPKAHPRSGTPHSPALGLICTPAKVAQVPHIPMLREDNVRTGFFEHEKFQELVKHLPEYLRPVAFFACCSGWRRGEILSLQWDQVDLNQGAISGHRTRAVFDRYNIVSAEDLSKAVQKRQEYRDQQEQQLHSSHSDPQNEKGAVAFRATTP